MPESLSCELIEEKTWIKFTFADGGEARYPWISRKAGLVFVCSKCKEEHILTQQELSRFEEHLSELGGA